MTSYVIRHRDRKRREQMIDEAVRSAISSAKVYLDVNGSLTVQDLDFRIILAEFRRLAAR